MFIQALKPKADAKIKAIDVTEWRWRPIRSVMAIANQRCYEKTGSLPVPYESMESLDGNYGYRIDDPNICIRLGEEMIALAHNPEVLEEYGMSVRIEDGSFVYTYPVDACTGCFEVRNETKLSQYWVSEEALVEISEFIRDSGGIIAP